jgi:erythromycin esterase
LILLLAVCSAACADGPKQRELEWIRTNAIPLKTCEAGHGFDDLQPLKALIGNAHIVSLGECTHGTREVFQMKHRLVEYLASQGGFTIFAIEANMPEAYRLNEYVLKGKGDPKQLIVGMYFWTWNTEEVLAMVEWMRQFNQSGKGRIEFTGFDMQTPDVAMEIVLDFLRRTDPQRLKDIEDTYHNIKNGRFRKKSSRAEFTGPTKENREDDYLDPAVASKTCGELVAAMEASRDAYVKILSHDEADWAIQNARIVHQCVQLAANQTQRDESMAMNVRWILDQAPKDTRIILWAHNGHVGREDNRGSGSMGRFLDKWYGKDQIVIGFAAGEGQYTARAQGRDLRSDNKLKPPVKTSYEEYFHASALRMFMLDLRNADKDDPASGWLTRPHLLRSIGALAMDGQFFSADICSLYDAIIYFDTTTASRSLPGAGARHQRQQAIRSGAFEH